MTESTDCHAARPTLIDQSSYTRLNTDHVGIQSKLSGHMLIHMGMRIDHSGDNYLPCSIYSLRCLGLREISIDGGNFILRYRNIEAAVAAGCWINQRTVLNNYVVHHALLPVLPNGSDQHLNMQSVFAFITCVKRVA